MWNYEGQDRQFPSARKMMSGTLILCYHRVISARYRDPYGIIDPLEIHVQRNRFLQHMEILSRRFTIVPLDEIVSGLVRGASVDGLAAVTFDDGYADNYAYALPILEGLGIPATVFLATDFVEERLSFWWDQLAWTLTRRAGGSLALPSELGGPVRLDSRGKVREVYSRLSLSLRAMSGQGRSEVLRSLGIEDLPDARPLTWSEIQSMRAHGISFGAHSCSHPSLPKLPDADLRDEIEESRDCILAHLGAGASRVFAYPYGDVDERVSEVTRTAGFISAATVEDRLCTESVSLFHLPRLMVRNWNRYYFAKALDALSQGGVVMRDSRMLIRQTINDWLPPPAREGIRRIRGIVKRWDGRRRRLMGS